MSFPPPPTAAFGTVFGDQMAVAHWQGGVWETPSLGPIEPFSFHPATHALHYGSTCFEGLKAHRDQDGRVRIFRLDRHAARMQHSAGALCLPEPPTELLTAMIRDTVAANLDHVPTTPGSLYIRPTLIGTEPNIGAAAGVSRQAMLYILVGPVGDYFSGGMRPLKLAIETDQPRTIPQFGRVKAGANYVMALGITQRARTELGADQVLFAPGSVVQETGASNFILIGPDRVITPALTDGFLHGVTRDSILRLASDLGYKVEERRLDLTEVLEWAEDPSSEAALTGTAAVLSAVGRLVHRGEDFPVGTGEVGEHTRRLRLALTDIHAGLAPDRHGWLTEVD